jgi:hypothetical protein
MKPTEILELLNLVPFRPFRIHISDGKTYTIDHPEQVMVTPYKLVIGLGRLQGRMVSHTEHCSLIHVTRLEEIGPNPAPVEPTGQ